MECKQKENLKDCNCSYNCDKKGICCECVKYPREIEEFPACFFSNEAEKSYDRSFEKLSRDRS